MISLYSGTPGSGKSLHLAERCYYWLRRGRPIIGNFDFNVDLVRGSRRRRIGNFVVLDNSALDPEFLISYSTDYFKTHRYREGQLLLVIDEAQLVFNSREWQSDAKRRKLWISFFSQHRKYGYDVVLVAQFDRMIDRQIRSLIEYEVIHRKVSNFGLWGKLFSAVVFGRLFVGVKVWYPLCERIDADFFVARKKYFRLYDTFAKFSSKSDDKA